MTPIKIAIQNTSFCNFQCSVCASVLYDKKIKREHMSDELFQKIIRDINDFDDEIPIFHFVGYLGEPTMHPKFIEQINQCCDLFPNSIIASHTNGSLITKSLLSQIPKRTKIILSCLGGKNGENNYETLTQHSWKYFKNICDVIVQQKYELIINLTTSSIHQLRETIIDLSTYDNITIILNPLIKNTNDLDNLQNTYLDDYMQIKNEFPALNIGILNTQDHIGYYVYHTNDYSLYLDTYKKQFKNRPNAYCVMPYEEMYIKSNGDVELCCVPSLSELDNLMVQGNIKNNTLKEIFNSERYNTIRMRLDKGIPGCKHCATVCSRRFNQHIPKELYE